MFGENATVLAVYGPGTPDAYSDVEDAGTALWEGRAPAYIRRERYRGGPEMTLVESDVLYVRDQVGTMVQSLTPGDQKSGNTILVEDARTTPSITRRFLVKGTSHRAGLPVVSSTRIELDDERDS